MKPKSAVIKVAPSLHKYLKVYAKYRELSLYKLTDIILTRGLVSLEKIVDKASNKGQTTAITDDMLDEDILYEACRRHEVEIYARYTTSDIEEKVDLELDTSEDFMQ